MNKTNTKNKDYDAILLAERDITVLSDKLDFMHKLIASGKYNNIEFAKRIARENFINEKNTLHYKLLINIEKCSKLVGVPHVFKNAKSSWSASIDREIRQIINQESYDVKILRRAFDAVEDSLIAAKRDILKISSIFEEQQENE